jgi:MFS family permease
MVCLQRVSSNLTKPFLCVRAPKSCYSRCSGIRTAKHYIDGGMVARITSRVHALRGNEGPASELHTYYKTLFDISSTPIFSSSPSHDSTMAQEEESKEAAALALGVEEPYSIFTSRQKAVIVAIVGVAATFSGFASNSYFPAIPSIAVDLSVTPELVNLTVTTYLIFQGLAPSLWGAIADVHGRRLTYICTFIILISACVGLARTEHYYQLVILRCLQSTGSSSTIAIGAGVIGDITRREERGGYMGIYQGGLLCGIAIAPILGGIFSQTLGWRAIFWFMAIYGGVFLMILAVILPETLRSLVGNGSLPTKGLSTSLLSYLIRRQHKKTQVPGSTEISNSQYTRTKKVPINILVPFQIIFGLETTYIIVFMSLYYTAWQMMVTVMSTLFQEAYGLSEIQIGLTFFANGVGSIIGTLTTGRFLDIDYARIKSKYTGRPEDFPLEHARLRTIWVWSGLQCASILIFGWTLQYHVHISVPIICTFFIGWAATSHISVVSTFMVDIFPKQAASATAAVNLMRCLMAAGGIAASLPVVNAIGAGWTFTIVVGLLLASSILVFLQLRYGMRRRLRREQRERDQDEQ